VAQTLADVGFKERSDLQQMIRNSPEAFFAELGEPLLLVAEELRPSTAVDDRIDLLAIDPTGAFVVIELKRGNDRLHLLQALSYAAMISNWTPDQAATLLSSLAQCPETEARSKIENFIEGDTDSINQVQRIILIAEEFDYEVLVTAEWLSERYQIDIRCHRIKLSCDNQMHYLTCSCVFPPPELAQAAICRKRAPRLSGNDSDAWATWDEALAEVSQPVADFFRNELARGRSSYLPKRMLRFDCMGRKRWILSARNDRVYVWQRGRFADDIAFWIGKLGEGAGVEPVKNGECLRFFMRTPEQFEAFCSAITMSSTDFQFSADAASYQSDDDS